MKIRPIVIPELIIKSIVDGILNSIRHDIEYRRKEEQLLFGMFADLKYDKYVYYDEAVALFGKNNGKARQIQTKL